MWPPALVAAVSTCRLWLAKPSGAVLLMGTAEFVVCPGQPPRASDGPKGLCSQSHESLHDLGVCDLVAKKQTEPVMT